MTRDGVELDRVARQIMHSPPSAIVLVGGDGTYLAGITALHQAAPEKALPPIAFARAGTVSIVARNWGSEKDAAATVRAVLEPRDTWTVTRRPTISVAERGGATRIGFTFGTGLVATFFDEYNRRGAGGNATALVLILRLFVGGLRGDSFARGILSPLTCRLTVDGVSHDASAFSLILASVLRDVGLHHHVAYRAGEDPERPHVIASVLPARDLALNWPRVLLGRPISDPNGLDRLAREIRVEFPNGGGPYVLDGDTFRAETVTVSAGPTIPVVT